MTTSKLSFAAWSVATLLSASCVAAQTHIYSVDGRIPGALYANSSATVGDVDLDGTPDFAVGTPYARGRDGEVTVYSGRNGAVIHQFVGDPGSKGDLGWSVASAGDVNRDGVPDIIAGMATYKFNGLLSAGGIRVYSGIDGSILYSKYGRAGDGFGWSVAGVGDINLDGYDDFAGGALQNSTPPNFRTGYAKVYSGRDGTRLYAFFDWLIGAEFGAAITSPGDVDEDGYPDIAVSSHLGQAGASTTGQGSVHVYSGATGKRLWAKYSKNGEDHFGASMERVDDLNDDGIDDIVAGTFNLWNFKKGTFTVMSGLDGTKLYSKRGGSTSGVFGRKILSLGDLDGDGAGDFAVTDAGASFGGQKLGAVRIYSGRTGDVMETLRGLADSGFGVSMAAFDLDRDNRPEMVIGSPALGGRTGRVDVLTLEDVISIGTGCGEGSRTPRLEATSAAVGQPMKIFVARTRPNSSGALLASDQAGLPVVLSSLCTAYLDASSAVMVQTLQTDAQGEWNHTFTLPSDPTLVGTEFAVQAVVAPTAGPLGVDLTNGVCATVQ